MSKKAEAVGKGNRYRLKQLLGSGSFGEVYLAIDENTSAEVAVKLEKTKTRHPQLTYESKVLKALQGPGIAKLHYFGVESPYNVLVTDRLGKSLEDLFNDEKRRFDNETTLYLGREMISRMEYMHQKHFIHRDIKPDNFLSGFSRKKGNKHHCTKEIYVIDFGLSKRYRHPKSKRHNPYREGKSLTGTPRYASINNHLGVEQSRRDDIESIGYVLVYFSKGKLPWQGLKAKTREKKYRKIKDKKMTVETEDLCVGTPRCMKKYIDYSRSLRYEDKPNYGHLKDIMNSELKKIVEKDGREATPIWMMPERKYKRSQSKATLASKASKIKEKKEDVKKEDYENDDVATELTFVEDKESKKEEENVLTPEVAQILSSGKNKPLIQKAISRDEDGILDDF